MVNERMGTLSKRPTNMGHKIPYVDIISEAIMSSPNRRLTAKEIFDHVSAKFGPMKSAETLKNTIRHTLSRYKIFRKVQRGKQKKPNWWTIEEEGSPNDNHHQIEDLQEDAKPIARPATQHAPQPPPPPPQKPSTQQQPMVSVISAQHRALHREPPPIPHQPIMDSRHMRRELLEVSSVTRQPPPSSFPYHHPATAMAPPHFDVYFPSPGHHTQQRQHQVCGQVEVKMEPNSGRSQSIAYNEYSRSIEMTEMAAAGPSHQTITGQQGYGGLPPIGEAVPYLFPYHQQDLQTGSVGMMHSGLMALPTATSSPGPQYYQM